MKNKIKKIRKTKQSRRGSKDNGDKSRPGSWIKENGKEELRKESKWKSGNKQNDPN